MPARKSSISLQGRLDAALHTLRDIALPPACVQLAREEAAVTWEGRRTFRRTPMLALLAFFSRPAWTSALREHPDLREGLAWVMERVAHQLAMAQARERTADLACRGARRYMLLRAWRPEFGDLACCEDYVTEELALPRLGGAPGSACIPRSESCIAAFIKALGCFRTGASLLAARRRSREKPADTFERFDDAEQLRGRFAELGSTQWSCLDPLRPVALEALRDARNFLSKGERDANQAGNFLIALLGIFYGLDHCDAMMFRLGAVPAYITGPGWIDLDRGRLVRLIGTGFFPGDGRFERSELSLPLVPEVSALARQLGLQGNGTELRAQLGRRAHTHYGRWLRKRRMALLPRMRLGSLALHRTFDYVALFHCGLYACELSLLRAVPLYGSATECSYITASGEELTGHWHAVVGVIRRWAGLAPWRGTVEHLGRQHGTLGPTLQEYVEKVLGHIRVAASRNEFLVCIEGLFRCLSRRHTARHENPAACVRGYPEPVMMLVDKWNRCRALGARYLPLVPAVSAFVDLCAQHCGKGHLVAYDSPGGPCISDAVEDRRLWRWLWEGSARQPARTALFNALRRRRVPLHVLNAALGHGGAFSWESALMPVPNAVLLAELAEALEPVLEQCGWTAAVSELGISFVEYSATSTSFRREEEMWAPGVPASAAAPFAPLSEIEDLFGSLIMQSLDVGQLPHTGWALAIHVALGLGVPFRLLRRNLRYMTFRCVVSEEVTGRAFICVPVVGPDVGHLDFYPIEIPKESVAWQRLLRRWEELRAEHRLARACLDAPLFDSDVMMADRIGKYMSRLASGGGKRLRLEDGDAVCLLERLSATLCRHWQPGSVAGVLAMEIPGGINQIDLAATISRVTGSEVKLQNLAGEPALELFRLRKGRMVAPEERRRHYERFLESIAHVRWPAELVREVEQAEYLHGFFADERVTPSRDRYRTVAMLMGAEELAAGRIAGLALQLAHRHGALEPTKPEALPTDEQVRRASERIALRELDVRHRSPAEKWRRIEDVARSLEMLVAEGCRLSEAILARPKECIEEQEWTGHWIPESKSDAGRRMVLAREFDGMAEQHPKRRPKARWQRPSIRPVAHRRTFEAMKALVQRQVKALFSSSVHVHSLRHYRAVVALLAVFRRKRQNLAATLSTLARMFGHASVLTFLNAYVGTMQACFAVRPLRLPRLPELWLRQCEARLRGKLRYETLLHEQYTGRAAARIMIRRECKTFEAAPSRTGTDDGNLECWDLIAERSNLELKTKLSDRNVRVLPLPPTPELPEYWCAVEMAWARALREGMLVIIDMPLALQRRWRKKIERLARSLGKVVR